MEESIKALNYFKALILPVYQQLSTDKRVAVEDFILCYEGMMIDLDKANKQLIELKESQGEAENIARTEAETVDVMIKERNEALTEIEALELKWVKSYKALWDELRKWISLWRDGVTDNEGYMSTCEDILDKIIALETDNKSVCKRKAVQSDCCLWTIIEADMETYHTSCGYTIEFPENYRINRNGKKCANCERTIQTVRRL